MVAESLPTTSTQYVPKRWQSLELVFVASATTCPGGGRSHRWWRQAQACPSSVALARVKSFTFLNLQGAVCVSVTYTER